jgi:hypothetical protein
MGHGRRGGSHQRWLRTGTTDLVLRGSQPPSNSRGKNVPGNRPGLWASTKRYPRQHGAKQPGSDPAAPGVATPPMTMAMSPKEGARLPHSNGRGGGTGLDRTSRSFYLTLRVLLRRCASHWSAYCSPHHRHHRGTPACPGEQRLPRCVTCNGGFLQRQRPIDFGELCRLHGSPDRAAVAGIS